MTSIIDDNLSAVLYKIDDLRIEEWPMPDKPQKNELLLRTRCVGICGSDVHFWKDGYIGNFVVTEPIILGHETCAEVVEVGSAVKNFIVGQRVITEPAVSCRHCDDCKSDRYNLCARSLCHGTPPRNGTLTQFFTHPADFTFKIPDNISIEEAAMIQPLTIAVHSCRIGKVSAGNTVLVCGAGPIGLLNVMVARACGATKICVTEINNERLMLAKQIGADYTVLIDNEDDTELLVNRVCEAFGAAPDITIECSGAPNSFRFALLATRSGGKAVMVGLGPRDVRLPISDAMIREVEILGCFRGRNCFPVAIDLVSSGKVNLKPLLTHKFNLKQSVDAFNIAYNREGIKVVIYAQ